ncbi:MAG TPA: WHG domain-containing protein [Candidatus Competibacteraceae bacterium]|nr:WHG domain-containing protein [Candidatus Competibacteraceae bacterium]
MGRRNDHTREELREMALQAAEKIIVEQGYAGLSARKVATEIGYTVGSLYLVFRNLDDLIVQVNARTLDELYDCLQTTVDERQPPRERILAMGRAYIDFATRHAHRWKLIFAHRLPQQEPTPESFIARVARMFELVRHHLQALAPQRSPEELALAAHALWSGVHGVAILGLDQKLQADHGLPVQFTVQEVADSLIDRYLIGLLQG